MSYMEMRDCIRTAIRNYACGLVNLTDLERMLLVVCVKYRQENMPTREVQV